MAQTSVEWLEHEIEKKLPLGLGEIMIDLFEQAKQMEREQIEKAFDYGDYCIDLSDGGWEQKYKSAEDYYNKTYGK